MELIGDAMQASQLWHDLLAICNQSLELSKCGYHAVKYEFLPTGEPKLTEQLMSNITLKDTNGNPIQILQMSNNTATKYLGTYKCPGNQNKQSDVLLKKCNDFAHIISAAI